MIRGLVFVVQLLFWLLVVRLIGRMLARAFVPGRARVAGPPRQPRMRPPEDLALDRVCRTYLPRSRAITASVAGRQEHFCSAACRDKALAAVAVAS